MYQDLDTKRPIPQKIADACARYEARFGVAPNVALVHPTEMTEAVVQVQGRLNVRPGTYWVGVEALPS